MISFFAKNSTGKGLLGAQLSFLGISIATGIPSYLTIFLASKNLGFANFASFIGFWTILNACGLVFLSPIEHYAARAKDLKPQEKSNFELVVSRWIIWAVVFSFSISVIFGTTLFNHPLIHAAVMSLLFLIPLAAWTYKKALNFKTNQPRRTLGAALAILVISTAFLWGITKIEPGSLELYLLALPAAWCVVSFGKVVYFVRAIRSNKCIQAFPELSAYISYSIHTATYAVLASAGIVLLSSNSSAGLELPSYVAIITLTRAGFQIVNTLTPAIALHYATNTLSLAKVRNMSAMHSSVALVAGGIAFLAFAFFGNWLVAFYIHSSLNLGVLTLLLIVLGESFWAAMSGISTAIIARGGEHIFVFSSVAAFSVFSLSILLFGISATGVGLASSLSGVSVIVVQYFWFLRVSKKAFL